MIIVGLCHVPALPGSWADDKKQTLQEMQKSLNEQVLSQPFGVAEEEQVKSYIADATKRGVVPSAQPGPNWRPGYTCADLQRYSWHEYRECRYYHWYYGYYYR
jgi:hypothetical protein